MCAIPIPPVSMVSDGVIGAIRGSADLTARASRQLQDVASDFEENEQNVISQVTALARPLS